MGFIVVVPFVGNDTCKMKVMQMANALEIGDIKNIELFDNYDSKKYFRSAVITYEKLYYNSNSQKVVEQFGIGGEVIVKMVTHKTTRWILRGFNVGCLMGMRPKKGTTRVFISV
jgi:hypothetical protein